jgi:hypothetical protein
MDEHPEPHILPAADQLMIRGQTSIARTLTRKAAICHPASDGTQQTSRHKYSFHRNTLVTLLGLNLLDASISIAALFGEVTQNPVAEAGSTSV